MNQPFISICIPTYKRPDLLKKLLDSIVVQTFTDFEIIINDNSPDDSVQSLIDGYRSQLPISYERNIPSTSAGVNCIAVMRRARGEWIKMMHDDDWFATPEALEQFATAAKNSGRDFIFCATNQVYLDGSRSEKDELAPWKKDMLDDSIYCLFYLNVIGHPSAAMHRRDAHIEYDGSFNWVLDIDFYMRYLQAHPGYHYLPATLVNIGKSPEQETYKYLRNIKVELPEYFRLLAKYDPALGTRNEYVFHLIWNMLKRYRIKHTDQIYAQGYTGPMPDKIDEIIAFQKWIPRLIIKQTPYSKKLMKICFKRIAKKV